MNLTMWSNTFFFFIRFSFEIFKTILIKVQKKMKKKITVFLLKTKKKEAKEAISMG